MVDIGHNNASAVGVDDPAVQLPCGRQPEHDVLELLASFKKEIADQHGVLGGQDYQTSRPRRQVADPEAAVEAGVDRSLGVESGLGEPPKDKSCSPYRLAVGRNDPARHGRLRLEHDAKTIAQRYVDVLQVRHHVTLSSNGEMESMPGLEPVPLESAVVVGLHVGFTVS